VPKILVADDNSNVQKTVALALADLGVEVVAVNNGEAAVRKLADISPDLVLADIFMPVRNGYEVCEFVKKDSRFSHLPVVLLVGAFDPLDEREAQRVGADGILKKPFVPPDPLIAMIKTLLDRSLGERLVAVAVAKPEVSLQSQAGGVAAAEVHSPPVEPPEEVPMEEFQPPANRLSFGEGERPVAFGQLLENPAQESAAAGSEAVDPVDDEQILTSSRDASLGDPIFWRTEEPQPESEEENSEEDRDVSSGLPMRPWKPDEEIISRAKAEPVQPAESYELVREEQDEDAGKASTIVESSPSIAQDAASQASLTVDAAKPEDLAANPIEWMASVPQPPAEEMPEGAADWGAAGMGSGDEKVDTPGSGDLHSVPSPAAPDSSTVTAAASVSGPKAEPPPPPTPAQPLTKAPAQSAEDTAHSIPKQEWADLASSLQAASIEPTAEKTKTSQIPLDQHPSEATRNSESAHSNSVRSVFKSPQQTAEDTAHSIPKQDWADLASNIPAKAIESAAEKTKPSPMSLDQHPSEAATISEHPPTNSVPANLRPSTQSAEDTAHSIPKQDWADMAASLQPKTIEPVTEKIKPATSPVAQAPKVTAADVQSAPDSIAQSFAATAANAEPASATSLPPGSPDPALVEAVVQRVLEKMHPQVVDIITKEFLRPVVQALVHREITKR
jgi:CheY-like chemotaxis protein